MSRGIFDAVPSRHQAKQDSPFTVVQEPAAPAPQQDSPFRVIDAAPAPQPSRFGAPAPVSSPFQAAEPAEGFGFEAPSFAPAPAPVEPVASPFAAAPAPRQFPQPAAFHQEPAPSPFAPAPQAAPAGNFPQPGVSSPFSPAQETAFIPQPRAAVSSFETAWQEPARQAAPQAVLQAQPVSQPVPQPASAPVREQQPSDSYSIRQLELRAIFGVDREMSGDEILQRARALPGMKNIARVGPEEASTVEALKTLLPSLGFGSGTLKLYAGSVPLEFIREGNVILAVQTDGGFAPGVRETLMLVARELGRMG